MIGVYLALLIPVTCSAPMRLIEFNESYRTWMSVDEVDQLAISNTGFFDVTDHHELFNQKDMSLRQPATQFPSELALQSYVHSLLPHLSTASLRDTITTLSSYPTRYYTTDTSVEAVMWLMGRYQQVAGARLGSDVRVELFRHSFAQPSLIISVKGNSPDPTIAAQTVILGGHIDSISNTSEAPGADDDASGSSVVFEVFSQLMYAGFYPERTLEFHVYAAEEVGLLGSQDIAEAYSTAGRTIYSMVQMDMVAWPHPQVQGQAEIGLIMDFTSPGLNDYLKLLMDEYVEIGYRESECGYGCSDHASWTKYGFDAVFPFEAAFEHMNPFIHTRNDTIENLELDHALQFARLGMGYTVEAAMLFM
jgi:leucyl aminopeptidase